MKICIISPIFPLPGNSPHLGPDNVIYNFLQSVAHNNSELIIDVVTILNDIDNEISDELFPNIHVTYLPAIKILPRSLTDPYIIKAYLKNKVYDLIHAHYPIALLHILNHHVPLVLTLHGIIWEEKKFVKNRYVNFFYHDYNTHVIKKILSEIDGFVAISPYVIHKLTEAGLPLNQNKIYQINNSISTAYLNINNSLEEHIIFYPAKISELKNQRAAIEAIKLLKERCKQIKLIFSGIPDKQYLKSVLDEVKSNGLTDYVEYVGVLNREQMLDYYKKASIVMLLSYQETQPMVILEAMAAGIPVIASNLQSISSIIEHGTTGYLVDPNDFESISAYIIALIENKNKRILMGFNAKEKALKYYNPHLAAEKTIEMYKSVLRKRTSY